MDALVFNLRQEHVVICDFVSTFHQVGPPLMILGWHLISACVGHFKNLVGLSIALYYIELHPVQLCSTRKHLSIHLGCDRAPSKCPELSLHI